MDDRALLEAAAKAAGYNKWCYCGPDGKFWWHEDPDTARPWNPLTDDGDALRLAVKLRLNLNFEEFDGVEYACAVPHKSHQGWDEAIGDDEAAATRRAIVRAAAAIGDAT